MALLKAFDESGTYDRPDIAINALRDEIVSINFALERGHNLTLSLLAAKLQEARGLAIQYGIEIGRIALVDRAKILAPLQGGETVTTVTTVPNGSENV